MNNKYNGFDFIYKNMPNEPLFRFKGSSVEEHKVWADNTKRKLKDIMGLNNIRSSDKSVRELESIDCGHYKRLKCEINTAENLTMPFYILKPYTNSNGKAAIAIHGHGSDGKEGLAGNEAEKYKDSVEKYSYTYAFQLLDKGYTVYIPDLLGAGERMLGIYKDNRAECNDINNALISMGMCLQGVILFENMCLVDYISEMRYSEINCCGFSGGGHSTLWLAVIDDRINKAIVSGFFHSYKDTLIYQNRCGCNFIPNIWNYVDMGDILALAAPKTIYLETGKDDKLNGEKGVAGVLKQLSVANNVYELYGTKVKLNVCNGMHKWYGSFIDKI